MKRNINTPSTASQKTLVLAATGSASATPLGKGPAKADAAVQPAGWTRYVDSRLKQFCVR